jgi:ubiquinone/menaquinone biosynthesis C-methylase UbiE
VIEPGPQAACDRFHARTDRYRRLGFDRLAAAAFVARAARLPAGPVLDVGTGKGLLAAALADEGRSVVSADVDRDELALAALLVAERGLAERIRFLRADAAALPFAAASFGACAMMDVLHHLADDAAVFEEMVRVLRPGGLLVVADFTAAGFDLVARVHAQEGGTHPVGPVTMTRAAARLVRLGLRAEGTCEGEFQKVGIFRRPEDGGNRLPGTAT